MILAFKLEFWGLGARLGLKISHKDSRTVDLHGCTKPQQRTFESQPRVGPIAIVTATGGEPHLLEWKSGDLVQGARLRGSGSLVWEQGCFGHARGRQTPPTRDPWFCSSLQRITKDSTSLRNKEGRGSLGNPQDSDTLVGWKWT